MSEFVVGDRVRIRRDRASGMILPYRKWGESGRQGSVISLSSGRGVSDGDVRVRFDTARTPKTPTDYMMWMNPRDIEKVTL